MTIPSSLFGRSDFTPSRQLISGQHMNNIQDFLTSVCTLTAKAGGGKAGATSVTGVNCRVSVCATGADSILLPTGYEGLTITVINDGAASCQVFGSGSDTIQGAATGTGVALANGATAMYKCVAVVAGVGKWQRFVSA